MLLRSVYSCSGTLLGAIDGLQNFADSSPGNGVAGVTFVVSAAEQVFVNKLLATGGPGTIIALKSAVTDFAGGPESFLIYRLGTAVAPIPEPETDALMRVGHGIVGFIARRGKLAS